MDQILDFKAALNVFGGAIRSSTLRAWVFQKKIPILKLGRKVAFKKSDIEAFIEQSYQKAD